MRYSHQQKLEQIGPKGQSLLSQKSVCIVGLGALGSVSAELLTRAGIGKLILIDKDNVEESNLHRQLLYSEKDIARPKVSAALNRLREINSKIEIQAHHTTLTADNTSLLKSDLILDGTDNLETRFIINDYAVKHSIPWIYAGAIQTRGFVFPVLPNNPCFECLIGGAISEEDCETQGILNTTNTLVGSIQVVEALKILLEKPLTLALIRINAWDSGIEKIKVKKNPSCTACHGKFIHLQQKEHFILHYCKSKAALEVKPLRQMNLNLGMIKQQFEVVSDAGTILVIRVEKEEVVVHKQGILMFKTLKDKEKAKELTEKIYQTGK